jgi:glycosyltransferase involved in cell wall biosynthesis
MNPEISIVVPTYKRPEKLQRALASIGAAVSCSHETIVVDDCLEGSGFAVANLHGARYVCKAGADRGPSASRNVGIGLARGQWIAFLDDDDYFAPQGLDGLLAKARLERGIVFGDYTAFNTETKADIDLSPVDMDAMLVFNRIPVGVYVMERGVITQRFDTRLRSHEDWDFLLTHTANNPLRHVPGIVALIDKSEVLSPATLARRRKLSWMDHLSIWARFPANHLNVERSNLLLSLGIQIPPELLQFDDENYW